MHRERQRRAQIVIPQGARGSGFHYLHNNSNNNHIEDANTTTSHHPRDNHPTRKMGSNPEPEPLLSYWQVNVAPEDRQKECPEAIRNISAKDISIISMVCGHPHWPLPVRHFPTHSS